MRLIIAATLFVVSLAAPALADVVQLTDGRRFEDVKTEWTKEGKLRIVLKMGELLVDRADVLLVEKQESPAAEYQRRRDALDPDDLAGAIALARFCMEHEAIRSHAARLLIGVTERARAVEAANAGDGPVQKQARTEAFRLRGRAETALQELDYHLVEGRWLAPEEYYPARGYVRFRGRWVTSAEAKRLQAARDKQSAERARRRAETEARAQGRQATRALAAHEKAVAVRDKALARVDHYMAEQKRLDEVATLADAELERRISEQTQAEGLERIARSNYDSWWSRKCNCEVCNCGWQTRHDNLQRILQDAQRLSAEMRRLVQESRRKAEGAAADQREVRKRLRDAQKKLSRAERELKRAESKLEAAERAAAESSIGAREAQDDVERAEDELQEQ